MSRGGRIVKGGDRAAQPNRQARHLDGPALDFSRHTYLTVREAGNYLRLPSTWAVYRWVKTNHVPTCRDSDGRGRITFLKRDLDEARQKTRNAGRLKTVA